MLIFTTTFLPMNFYTKTHFIPWMPLLLYSILQHHIPLLILLCLITAQTSAATRVTFEVIDVPTAAATLTRIGANLLQTNGQIIVQTTTQGLGSGLDNSMSIANCAPVSVTQLPIVPSFTIVPSSPLLTLLLGMFLLQLGSPTPASTRHN